MYLLFPSCFVSCLATSMDVLVFAASKVEYDDHLILLLQTVDTAQWANNQAIPLECRHHKQALQPDECLKQILGETHSTVWLKRSRICKSPPT